MRRFLSILALLCLPAVSGCGGSGSVEEPPLRPEWRGIITRALRQAEIDSATLSAGGFHAVGTMTVEFGRDGGRVRIDDRFRLLKDAGAQFRTEPVEHRVSGDTALLDDMYTFKTSRGDARSPERAEMGGISFGADFPAILRAMLAGGENGCTLRDSAAVVSGRPALLFSFAADGRHGSFTIGRDSCDLLALVMEQESSFVIGGYTYRMATEFGRTAGGLLLPLRTLSRFEYSRLSSDGTGSISVSLDSVRLR